LSPTPQKRPKLNPSLLPTLDPKRRRRKLPRNKKLLLLLLNLDLLRKGIVPLVLRLRRMSRVSDISSGRLEIGGIMKFDVISDWLIKQSTDSSGTDTTDYD
jgi:hypothetical protein